MSDGPGPRPRLVVSDLDGTLLRTDATVSPRTRAAVDAVVASGTPFVLATGRPPRWLEPVLEQLPHRGIAVCANGAVVLDSSTGTVLDTDPLDPSTLAWLVAEIGGALAGLSFGVEYGDSFAHDPSYVIRGDSGLHRTQVVELAGLSALPAVKLLVRAPDTTSEALAAVVEPLVGHRVQVTYSMRGGILEISAAGISKASGIARAAADLGVVAADALVFGDMPNDVEMFGWAGTSVAMANAHPAVRAAADHGTGTNDEDGVAAFLDRWEW